MERVETENLIALFQPAASDILVVTFAHMDFDVSGSRFWGQEALRKGGFASLGLICKSNCWFPEADMLKIKEFLTERTASFRKVISYGFSMGGYGAIKFSGLLRADCTISLSPQYSIDPIDVSAHDRRLMRHFIPQKNVSMAVRESDVHGRIVIFFDPYIIEDLWNSQMIASQCGMADALNLIHVPWIGHETIDLFAGTDPLRELVMLVAADDMQGLTELSSRMRRTAQRRIFNTLCKTRERSSEKADRLVARYLPELSEYWRKRLGDAVIF